jgi:5-methylthioadenosine/S-adenosylhomocysteine deaminase
VSARLLVSGGTVLSLDRAVGNLQSGDVLVEDGVITEVGTSLRARNVERIDATDAVVMPGFVDTHRHAWHSLLRHLGLTSTPIAPASVGPHYRPDDVYAATLVGLLGALRAGITTVVDWADVSNELPHVEAALQAHADAGARTVFVAAAPEWRGGAPDPAVVSHLLADDQRPIRTPAVGLDGDDAEPWGAARRHGVRIFAHSRAQAGAAHAAAGPATGAVAALGDAGLLGPDVTLVHHTNLDERDLDAIASAGAAVSLAPTTEMSAGTGWPPLQAFIDRGIRPGLAVGSEMESPGDLFAQMRLANSSQHARVFDLKLSGKGGIPNLLNTRDVIRYATIDGATAIGLGELTGSLAPGKRADLVVLRADRPNIAPVNDPIGAVVWGMDTSNIDWVIVDGRVVVRHGEPVADVARARELAATAHHDVMTAAGLLAGVGAGHR